MKNKKLLFSGLFILFLSVSFKSYSQKKKVKEVNSLSSFFKALDDNVEILIKIDTLDFTKSTLQEALPITTFDGDSFYPYQRAKKTYFLEKDGLVLYGYENLSIKGSKNLSKLISHNSYDDIITFKNCKNLTLENIVVEHIPDNCTGLVLSLVFTQDASIKNCYFNGSGAVGVNLIGSENLIFKDVHVFNNAFHAISAINSSSIEFVDSEIYENNTVFDEYNLLDIQFSELNFKNCNFENNKSNGFYNKNKDLKGYHFSLEEEEFTNYYKDDLTQNLDVTPFIPILNNCSFFNNAFKKFESRKEMFNESLVPKKEIFVEFFIKKLIKELNEETIGIYNDSFLIFELTSFFKIENLTLNENSQQFREDFIPFFNEVLSSLVAEKFVFKDIMASSNDTFLIDIRALSENKEKIIEIYVEVSEDFKIEHFEVKKY